MTRVVMDMLRMLLDTFALSRSDIVVLLNCFCPGTLTGCIFLRADVSSVRDNTSRAEMDISMLLFFML